MQCSWCGEPLNRSALHCHAYPSVCSWSLDCQTDIEGVDRRGSECSCDETGPELRPSVDARQLLPQRLRRAVIHRRRRCHPSSLHGLECLCLLAGLLAGVQCSLDVLVDHPPDARGDGRGHEGRAETAVEALHAVRAVDLTKSVGEVRVRGVLHLHALDDDVA